MKHDVKILSLILLIAGIMFIGCAGSDESAKQNTPPAPAQPSATEVMQNEMTALKAENASLKDRIIRMEQDARATTAHTAELETQLAELKERIASVPSKPVRPPVSSNARTAYDEALRMFRARKYQDAAATFQEVLEGGNAGSLESNCHYWLGECAYATKSYKEAMGHFQNVFGFAHSTKKDDAQLMIANCYLGMGDKPKAKTEYQKLIDKYPASPYVKRAKAHMGQM